jgi:hypothetical protein
MIFQRCSATRQLPRDRFVSDETNLHATSDVDR